MVIYVPIIVFMQVGESKYVFEAKTIQRMELLVLSTLRWRMQVITPFSFMDYFLCKISDDQTPQTSFILRSIQIILSTVRGTRLFPSPTLFLRWVYCIYCNRKEPKMITWWW